MKALVPPLRVMVKMPGVGPMAVAYGETAWAFKMAKGRPPTLLVAALVAEPLFKLLILRLLKDGFMG